jgi:hypothetical protein
MQARLQSEEGQRCPDEFASVIAEWAAKSMPIQLLQNLGTPEGWRVLQDLWPDMANAFFKAHSTLGPSNNQRRFVGAAIGFSGSELPLGSCALGQFSLNK